MKNLLIIILIILSNFSCEIEKKGTTNCFLKNEREEFITQLLNNNRVSNYLHLEINERNPIKLKVNELITKDLSVVINNYKVLVTGNDSFKDLITLKILNLDCKKNELTFSIFFKIENAIIEGKAKKINKNIWIININKDIEF